MKHCHNVLAQSNAVKVNHSWRIKEEADVGWQYTIMFISISNGL